MSLTLAVTRAVALFAIGVAACIAPMPACVSRVRLARADSVEIARLRDTDMRAVLRSDADTLVSLWTDDIVAVGPDGVPHVGRATNAKVLHEGLAASRDFEPVTYRLHLEVVAQRGRCAIEAGTYEGTVRARSTGQEIASGGLVARMICRDPDGRWRIARTLFTADST